MVCHPMPPPLPSPRIVHRIISGLANDPEVFRISSGRHISENQLLELGVDLPWPNFTRISDRLFCYHYSLFIVRTAEEGWVAIQYNRWKKLGWFDCIWESDWSSSISRNALWNRVEAATRELKKVILKDQGSWLTGDSGWRKDVGTPLRPEELARLNKWSKYRAPYY